MSVPFTRDSRLIRVGKIEQEDERHRIAQELHDGTTQELLVVANRAQALVASKELAGNSEASRCVEWIRDAVLHISEDIRRMSLDSRPSMLDEMGLVSALRWSVDHRNHDSGVNIKLILRGKARKLNPEVEVNVYRRVQELLSNLRRHSNAS